MRVVRLDGHGDLLRNAGDNGLMNEMTISGADIVLLLGVGRSGGAAQVGLRENDRFGDTRKVETCIEQW